MVTEVHTIFNMSIGSAIMFLGLFFGTIISFIGILKFWKNSKNGNGNGNISKLTETLDFRFSEMKDNMKETGIVINKNFDKIFYFMEGNGTIDNPGFNARLYNIEKMIKRNEDEHKEIFERLRTAKL
jgi:hypothetical protein